MIFGGICRRTVPPVVLGVCASAVTLSSTAMSASCSVLLMWRTCRLRLGRKRGSATPLRPGKKAQLKTPTVVPDAGFPANVTFDVCRIRTSKKSATVSTTRPENASGGRPPQKSSAKRCWRKYDETLTLAPTRVAVQISLTRKAILSPVSKAEVFCIR